MKIYKYIFIIYVTFIITLLSMILSVYIVLPLMFIDGIIIGLFIHHDYVDYKEQKKFDNEIWQDMIDDYNK